MLFWGYCNSEVDPQSCVYAALHSPRTPPSVPLDHSKVPPETVSKLQLNFCFHQVYAGDIKGLY